MDKDVEQNAPRVENAPPPLERDRSVVAGPASSMAPLEPLLETVRRHYGEESAEPVRKACSYAARMHEGQTRANGEDYVYHPIAVAQIVAELNLDPASVITAILHDTVEDTPATLKELQKNFGDEVAHLVDGVTKLNRIESTTVEGKQAENFRKLLVAMSEDIRVLLVKLADRLHNMRTLHFIDKPEKRARIAQETLDIYAPLAERIGMHTFKEELQDISFGVLSPEARDSITSRLAYLREEGSDLVRNILDKLNEKMKAAQINAHVSGREKTRYSIWKKMQRKNVAFEQLSDIMAFRIVVDNIEECYHALGVIHSAFPTVPGRFKDYISTPKPNGYRSIHTTIIVPENQRIEVQIRTHEMHVEADYGVAAHWAYKQKGGRDRMALQEGRKYRWLRELLEILDQESRPEEFLEHTKLALFQDQVYVFTPKGEVMELPRGATPVDFAYAIHSDLGNKITGAKLNGRIVPLNTKLQNGDQIEIQTSKNQTPSPTWERFVVTGKARSHIRRFIRAQQRDEYIQLGRAMLQKHFRQEGKEYTEKAIGAVAKHFKCDNGDELCHAVGSGHITARDVFKHIHPPEANQKLKKAEAVDQQMLQQAESKAPAAREPPKPKKTGKALPIKGLIPGMAVHFARCCHPLPGDPIVGIVTTGKGVTIHTNDCETLETFADTPERWLDVSWGEGPDSPEAHVGRLNLTIANKPGSLGAISTIIAKANGNITNLKIVNREADFWDMYLDVYVQNLEHLHSIIASLRTSPHIAHVERAKGR